MRGVPEHREADRRVGRAAVLRQVEKLHGNRIEDLAKCVEPAVAVGHRHFIHAVPREDLVGQAADLLFESVELVAGRPLGRGEAPERGIVVDRRLQAGGQAELEQVEIERALAAIDADPVALVADFPGVAGGTAKTGPGTAFGIGLLGESDREAFGIGQGLCLQQESDRLEILLRHEELVVARELEGLQPAGRDQPRAERSEPGTLLDLGAPALLEIDRTVATGHGCTVCYRLA